MGVSQAIANGRYPMGGPMDPGGTRWWGVSGGAVQPHPDDGEGMMGDFTGESVIRLGQDIESEDVQWLSGLFQEGDYRHPVPGHPGAPGLLPNRFLKLTALDITP